MANGQSANDGALSLLYYTIRNLTSPAEKANGVQTWFANLSARAVLSLGTRDNLRSYIAEHSPSKRNPVHKQIENTIIEMPDRFINRNSGITITCSDCIINDDKKIVTLTDASIINGSQTQGELRRYFERLESDDDTDFQIRAEIIMDPSPDSIVEIAIARNTATSVKSVSQAGARGYLDDLKIAIEDKLPGETLQTKETDIEGIGAQKVLQYSRLLMPPKLAEKKASERNFAYKQGGKCLTDFADWARDRNIDPVAQELYDFTVQIAPTAIREYRHWEDHAGWYGHRLHEVSKTGLKPKGGRPVRRDKNTGAVIWVAPGILFPMMAALSAFVVKENGLWILKKPGLFKEEELIRRAVQQFRALNREVAMMGRSEAAYDALSIYTETIASVLAQQE